MKEDENSRDARLILEDLGRFSRMSFEDVKRHWADHPEDLFHLLSRPGGGGGWVMSRESSQRFLALATRRLKHEPHRHSISRAELERQIRLAFINRFIVKKQPIERKYVDRFLNEAVRSSRTGHESVTRYLPCVLVFAPSPSELSVGPVRFLTSFKFFADYGAKIEADDALTNREDREELDSLIASGKYRADQKMSDEKWADVNQDFFERVCGYYRRYTWVAEVSIPACEEVISKERASEAVQAALDLIKLGFGDQGAHFRIGHEPGLATETSGITLGAKGRFHLSLSIGGEGALAEEGWFDALGQNAGWVLNLGGAAIEGYIHPELKTDHQGRWLDALHWYGQAVSDRRAAGQLVKFVAALERLTVTTETPIDGVADVVTRRTALLSTDGTPEAIFAASERAREVYRWRSDLMHGRSSPVTPDLKEALRTAKEILPQALAGALWFLWELNEKGARTSKDLEAAFRTLEGNPPDP